MKKLLKSFLAVLITAGMFTFTTNAGAQPVESDFTAPPSAPSVEDTRMESMVYLQNGMRAVVITPGVDFAADAEMSESDLR